MRTITQKIGILAFGLLLTGQGCTSLITGEEPLPPDGGLFASEDGGGTWQHRVLIPTVSGQPGTISSVNVRTLLVDPTDRKAIYLGSQGNGLIYSYDQGRTWQQAPDVRGGNVFAVAIDAQNSCLITIAAQNKIMQSRDCNRSYSEIYIDQSPTVMVSALAIHPTDSSIMLAGTSAGNVLRTNNGGQTWNTVQRFTREVKQVLFKEDEPNVVFALVGGEGIKKSADFGDSFIDITPPSSQYSGASEVGEMVWDNKAAKLYVSSRYGIHMSENGGESWSAMKLFTGPGEAKIVAMAVHPKNSNQMMYSTSSNRSSTFYATSDGGQTWASAKAPTSRAVSGIAFDPEAPHILYISAFALSQ